MSQQYMCNNVTGCYTALPQYTQMTKDWPGGSPDTKLIIDCDRMPKVYIMIIL